MENVSHSRRSSWPKFQREWTRHHLIVIIHTLPQALDKTASAISRMINELGMQMWVRGESRVRAGRKETMGDSCSGSPSVRHRLLYFSRGWQHCGGISCSWGPHGRRHIPEPGTQALTLLETVVNSTSFSSKLWHSFFFSEMLLVGEKKKHDRIFKYLWSDQQWSGSQSPCHTTLKEKWVEL